MQISGSWHSYSGPATAAALVKRLSDAFAEQADVAQFDRLEGLPSLELVRYRRLWTLADAVRIARTLKVICQCPVHFHHLERGSVAFLVFHPSLAETPFSHEQLREHGVPLGQWLPSALKDGPRDNAVPPLEALLLPGQEAAAR